MEERELKKTIKESFSIAEVLKKMDMSISTGNYRSFHRNIKKFNIDTGHFLGQAHLKGKANNIKTTQSLDKILVKNSSYCNIAHLKKRLIRDKLLEYKCYDCGINSWRGKGLSLQLDHINGIHDDHRIKNLRLLCPNCHSQTSTFSGKNKK
jgi:Zn finger protein HypA/HybF involved in hydrogenase expression